MDTEEEEPLLTCYKVRRFPGSDESRGQCYDCGISVYLGNMVYHDPLCTKDFCEKHWTTKLCDCGNHYCQSTYRCVDCASKILDILTMRSGHDIIYHFCRHHEFVDNAVMLKCRPLFCKVPTKSAMNTPK